MRILIALVLTLGIWAGSATAICVSDSPKLIVGWFKRCEPSRPYIESVVNAAPWLEDRDHLPPNFYGDSPDLVEISEQQSPGTVLVMSVQYHVFIGGQPGKPIKGWTRVEETVRYWWRGPAEICEMSWPEHLKPVELLARRPCCDVLPAMGACLVGMRYAEPIPDDMRDSYSKLLTERPELYQERLLREYVEQRQKRNREAR